MALSGESQLTVELTGPPVSNKTGACVWKEGRGKRGLKGECVHVCVHAVPQNILAFAFSRSKILLIAVQIIPNPRGTHNYACFN